MRIRSPVIKSQVKLSAFYFVISLTWLTRPLSHIIINTDIHPSLTSRRWRGGTCNLWNSSSCWLLTANWFRDFYLHYCKIVFLSYQVSWCLPPSTRAHAPILFFQSMIHLVCHLTFWVALWSSLCVSGMCYSSSDCDKKPPGGKWRCWMPIASCNAYREQSDSNILVLYNIKYQITNLALLVSTDDPWVSFLLSDKLHWW